MGFIQSALQQAKNMAGNTVNNVVSAVKSPWQPGGQFGPLISPLSAPGAVMPPQAEQWRQDPVTGESVPRWAPQTPPVQNSVQSQKQSAPVTQKSLIARNPNAKNFNINEKVVDAINKAATHYGIPASLLGDIALQESSFDPSKDAFSAGYDGKTIDPSTGKPYPYSTSKGLYMFNDPTWNNDVQNYANMKGTSLVMPSQDRMDPYTSSMVAAYLIKNGQLGRWNPSAGVWGPQYSYDELAPYYSQTSPQDIPARTTFKQ